jgi:hypothetical protein
MGMETGGREVAGAALIRKADPAKLDRGAQIELLIVESGIRRDQGLADAAERPGEMDGTGFEDLGLESGLASLSSSTYRWRLRYIGNMGYGALRCRVDTLAR